jgi:hypothetical protein
VAAAEGLHFSLTRTSPAAEVVAAPLAGSL